MEARGESTAFAPPPPGASPVSIWLSAERVPPGPAELVAVVVNRTDEEAFYGIAGAVDRWDGGAWVPHRVVAMCMDHWHCTSELRPVGEGLEIQDIGLSASLGRPGPAERFTTDGLEVGWYRVSQTVDGGTVVSGTFEVTDGVAPPAPLVSVDAPAISISPVVVSPAGGEVSLYPLIPAPSGNQSADDIHRAVEGLAEVAAIETWDGERWAQVTEVTLTGQDPESHDRQRTADLPALDPGAYRLVRTGPAGDHAGHFWVAATRR